MQTSEPTAGVFPPSPYSGCGPAREALRQIDKIGSGKWPSGVLGPDAAVAKTVDKAAHTSASLTLYIDIARCVLGSGI